MKEVFENMAEISETIFKGTKSEHHILKLIDEAEEALKDPSDLYEYVDCILPIFAAVHKAGFSVEELIQAAKNKIEILKIRKWVKNENGTYQHLK